MKYLKNKQLITETKILEGTLTSCPRCSNSTSEKQTFYENLEENSRNDNSIQIKVDRDACG